MAKKSIFTSVHGKLTVWIGDTPFNFEHRGPKLGMFITEDPKEIETLRAHPSYGKLFHEHDMPVDGNLNNIIKGVRSAGQAVMPGSEEIQDIVRKEVLSASKMLFEKFKRYDELKPRVVTLEGVVKKTALPEEIREFEELAAFLGLVKQPETV